MVAVVLIGLLRDLGSLKLLKTGCHSQNEGMHSDVFFVAMMRNSVIFICCTRRE